MAAAAAYFAENTHNHGRPVGRAGLLAVLDDIQTTFPDVQFKLIEAVAEGEWVVVRGIFSGTHSGIGRLPVNGGMLVGVPSTGATSKSTTSYVYKCATAQSWSTLPTAMIS
jgi:predicted ester cyclase